MKKIILTCLPLLCIATVNGQNYISGPTAVFGSAYNPETTISGTGSILIGSGGNWIFGGKITSEAKGNPNTPTAAGRAQAVTFAGTGTFTDGVVAPGGSGYYIDGYAVAAPDWTGQILPVGSATTAYPVTIPLGSAITVAYFDGSGATQNVNYPGSPLGATVVEYSPYLDLPSGFPAGSYTISYPGFPDGTNSALLSSGNTSDNGTSGSTAYSLLSTVPDFGTGTGITTAALPASGATQVYFSAATTPLPVSLVSFDAAANGCKANLVWKTASEANSSYFAIEVSRDGVAFTELFRVASNNSASGANYAYTFEKLDAGATYFRLKMVDKDSRFRYGPVRSVTGMGDCGTGPQVKVSPNPATDRVVVEGITPGSHLSLLDASGRKLQDITAAGIKHVINLSPYAQGVYFLRVESDNDKTISVKIVKK